MDRHKTLEVAVLVSTYQRPRHLERCLLSIALQKQVAGAMEVVVTDDGSTDETHELVAQFARSVTFPVRLTTHPHSTFQLARCRNEGAAASAAPYLVFLDGDCILPPDHLYQHLRHRQAGLVRAGYCVNFDQATSDRVTADVIRCAEFTRWGSLAERWKLRKLDWKSRYYYATSHPLKPRLFGGNIGIARKDYEQINGYDENFQGWGCEDDDLRIRLRRAGKRIASILRWTRTYHLWHPPGLTTPMAWREGSNVTYLQRSFRLTRCRNGLVKRSADDLRMHVLGLDRCSETLPPGVVRAAQRQPSGRALGRAPGPAEVEVLVAPSDAEFSGEADCNVLVMLDQSLAAIRHLAQAHVVVTDEALPGVSGDRYRLDQFEEALRKVA